MGRATITGGGDDGLYTASVVYDTSGAATAIAAIDAEIPTIDEAISLLEAEIEELSPKIDELRETYTNLAKEYNELEAKVIEGYEESIADLQQVLNAHEETSGASASWGGLTLPEKNEIALRINTTLKTLGVSTDWGGGGGGDAIDTIAEIGRAHV